MRMGRWTCVLAIFGGLMAAGIAQATDIPCDPTGAALGGDAAVPRATTSRSAAVPGAPWLRVTGRKYWAPEAQRAEAGLSLTVSETVSVLLNYERTAYGRTMPRDEDNGVLTRLKLAF